MTQRRRSAPTSGSASLHRRLHVLNITFINLFKMTSLEMITTKELGKLELSEPDEQSIWKPTPSIMVDTSVALKSLVDTLMSLEQSFGSVYMDLEGVKLSRLGSISLIQILVPSSAQAFILDVHTLGKTAFDTFGSEGKSLKDALESDNIKKYLFDVRNDSDALFALFGVRLAGAVDIQLLELASRRGDKHVVCGLAKCIEQEQALPLRALEQWQSTKKEVVKMFDPKLGGSYEVFNARPLPQILIEYCVGDVDFLPLLSAIYQSRLDSLWLEEVRIETEKRLKESRSPSYQPHGKQKSLGPRKWRYPPKEGQVIGGAPKKERKSSKSKKSSAVQTPNNLVAPVAAPVHKNGEKPTAAVPAPAPKKEKKPTAVEGGFKAKKGKQPTATAPSALKKGHESTGVGGSAPEKEKNSIAIVPEGGGKGKPKVGGGKGKSKHPSTFAYSDVSFQDSLYAKDWSVYDKDCGWCGRCGDGIL
jgi:exonuclease 3'-5' domain-containing protein 1